MSDYPLITCMLYGTLVTGEPSEIGLAVRVRQPITRTIGLQGNVLALVAPRTWPEEWDLSKAFRIVFGDDTAVPDPGEGTITLGGYMLRQRRSINFGREFNPLPSPPPPPPPTTTPHHYECVFETVPALWRDGRGGLLTTFTHNPLGADGMVDTGHVHYRTPQECVDTLLNALAFDHDNCPAGINTAIDGVTTLTAPGPLEWGNCRALPELESLLAMFGWVGVFYNDGSKIKVVRLARAGEAFTPSSLINDHAEPYELDEVEAARPTQMVVSSGRTRATCVSQRTIDAGGSELVLTWTRWDEDAGEWVDESAATQLTAFQAGPIGADDTARDISKVFTSVRLHEDEREAFGAFVTLPVAPESAGYAAFARAACMFWMRGCVTLANGQFVNAPLSAEDDPIIVDGGQAIAGDGVFMLPRSLRAVRMPDGQGAYADADHLTGNDLVVRFAHESRTGIPEHDYYFSGWRAEAGVGVINVVQMNPLELVEALEDPMVPKVEAPFLRRLMVWEPGVADPASVNDADLDEIAEEIALLRLGVGPALAGTITLRGLHDVTPGDESGSVGSVSWAFDSGWMTVLTINQHELPNAWWDSLQRRAGRSIAAGVERLVPAGSAVALAQTRAGSTPGDMAGVYGAGATAAPEAASGKRGREKLLVAAPAKRAAPEPSSELPSRAEAGRMEARITGATEVGTNRWRYEWVESKWDGETDVDVGGGRTSDTHGFAYNRVESHATTRPAPIPVGTVVELKGPRPGPDDEPVWIFGMASGAPGAARQIKARITSATVIAGQDYEWLYEWEEMEHTSAGWSLKSGGLTSADDLVSTFTVDATGNTIDPASDLSIVPDGFACRVSTTGTLPAPLNAGTDYFGRFATQGAGPYTLHTTRAHAIAGTSPIDLTTAGTGTHTITIEIGGKARNLNEHAYGGPPTHFSPGIELATIPAGFDMQPIRGTPIVTLEGPYEEIDGGTVLRWYFSAENAIDGQCEVSA